MELKKKVELLERLDEKREHAAKAAAVDTTKEIENLKKALEQEQADNDNHRHVRAENQRLRSHVKELSRQLAYLKDDYEGLHRETKKKYELKMDKLLQQNNELKKDNIRLAGSLNRHIEQNFASLRDNYVGLQQRYRNSAEYKNNNMDPSVKTNMGA